MDLSDKDSNRHHFAMKTDLNLLLECLKYQMDSPASQKQALVTICSICQQNENGQSLVKTTGCIDILLDLLRTSFPFSDENGTNENITQGYQLWSSVSSALCACVNNPQNEENQRICTAAFPFLKEWLQKCVRKEITQPICSFVGLTVANNPYSQGFFAAVCGLDTLAQVFVKLVDESSRNPLSGELAVVVTKTLCACIADNVPLAAGLSKYHIVPKLLTLLSCSWLDSGGRLCIILTIGHCTEACGGFHCGSLTSAVYGVQIKLTTVNSGSENS